MILIQSPDACKSLIDDLCAQRTDNDSIDILSVRDSAAKAGLSSKQSLAIQAVACQKSTGKDLKIKVKDFKKILEKQTIDQAGNKKEPHYPDDDMLDGWDEDFDVKEQITPRDDTMKQGEKENIDDYDDFEEESGNKPFPNPKARTDKDLDDYLDEF